MANNSIQVLALDDDNHSVCFVTRGSYYSSAANFMQECLLKPHTVEYEVRYVALVDMTGDEDEDMATFDLCACTYDPGKLFKDDNERWVAREKAFDTLWKQGEREYFYV